MSPAAGRASETDALRSVSAIYVIVMDDADLKAIEDDAKLLRPALGMLSSRAVTAGAATTSSG